MYESDSQWNRLRSSKVIVVVIVFVALLCDSLLLTLVDPILPDMLSKIDARQEAEEGNTSLLLFNQTQIVGAQVNLDARELNSNGRFGYLIAAKGAAQFIFNPFVGALITKTGYRSPLLGGSILLIASTIAFAFSTSYEYLFATRFIQGAASSLTAVSGMGLVAATYMDDDKQRGKAMGYAIGGLSFGIVAGPVYGSVLYQFVGEQSPFFILAAMVGVVLLIQMAVFKSDSSAVKDHSMSSICYMVADPYILVVAVNIFLLNLDVSIILAFLPMRLIELEQPPTWKLGIVVLPASIGYMFAGFIFPHTTSCLSRWLCSFLGFMLATGTLIGTALCDGFIGLLTVTFFLGLSLGMVSCSMQPVLAFLVDIRHSSAYGNVYAISDMAVCLAMFLGPLIGGPLVFSFGFPVMLFGVAALNFLFSPFCLFLRNPAPRLIEEVNEKTKLLGSDDSGVIEDRRSQIARKRSLLHSDGENGDQAKDLDKLRYFGNFGHPCSDYNSDACSEIA